MHCTIGEKNFKPASQSIYLTECSLLNLVSKGLLRWKKKSVCVCIPHIFCKKWWFGKDPRCYYHVDHSLGNMAIVAWQDRPDHRNCPSKQLTGFSFQLFQSGYAYKLREKNSATWLKHKHNVHILTDVLFKLKMEVKNVNQLLLKFAQLSLCFKGSSILIVLKKKGKNTAWGFFIFFE